MLVQTIYEPHNIARNKWYQTNFKGYNRYLIAINIMSKSARCTLFMSSNTSIFPKLSV